MLHGADAHVLGGAHVPGTGMQGLERECTCPEGLSGCRQGAGSQRVRAVPHSLCAVCYPPLAASQLGSKRLLLSPTQLPSGVCAPQPCTTQPCTPQPPSPHGRVPGLHPPLRDMSSTLGEHMHLHYPPSCKMPPLQRC